MASITITDIIKDASGDFPTNGTITFRLSDWMTNSAGRIIIPTNEIYAVSSVDGTFSAVLESTADATPGTRTYSVTFAGTLDGASTTINLGSITVPASPASQDLSDLLTVSMVAGGSITIGTMTIQSAAPVIILKETDQTLPLGLWRFRLNGDVILLEKNTAVAGDFSTLKTQFQFLVPGGISIGVDANSTPIISMGLSSGAADTFLYYQSTGNIQQRVNSAATAQQYVFHTGDTTDYEEFVLRKEKTSSGGDASLKTLAGGTGVGRNIALTAASNIVDIKNLTSPQELRVYGTTTGPKYTSLRHDGTYTILGNNNDNSIYLQTNNGAGSWIMSGSASSYTLLPGGDNSQDLALSNFRIRTGYFGTSINIGITTNTAGNFYIGSNSQATIVTDTAVTSGVASLWQMRKARGTEASLADAANGDVMGGISFQPYSGSTYWATAHIQGIVDGTFTSNQRPPSRLEFYTNAANGGQTNVLVMNSSQQVLAQSPTGGLGYGTGAGGTVTQITSKSTGVTLNKICGQITMFNASLSSGAKVSFAVSNSTVAAIDNVIVAVASGGTANAYRAEVTAIGSSSFTVTVENITGGSLSEAPVITFSVLKSVIS